MTLMNSSDATNISIPLISDPALEESIVQKKHQGLIDELKPGTAMLITLDAAGQRFLIDNDFVNIGRDAKTDIFLNDSSVSRRHVEITRRDNRFFIQDVGSLNGTYVNRELKEDRTELFQGDEVQIGRFRLIFFKSE
jgi:pSer/pThr/pTyr-binding forkhead associated (FHA) protein